MSVDHLRAFAALLVLLYHGTYELLNEIDKGHAGRLYADNPFGALVVEGHTAVTLFMVLSGFIFTIGTLGKDIHYGRFIGNRVLRIFPLYLVLIVMGVGAYRADADLLSVVQSLVGLGNLSGALHLGSVSHMWWAIAVELQFYLLFPLLSRILTRRGPLALIQLTAAVAVIRALVWFSGGGKISAQDLVYYSLAGRIDQFLFGMLAAWLFVHHRERFRSPAKVLVASALALVTIWAFNRSHAYAEGRTVRLVWVDVEGFVWALLVLTYVATVTSTCLVSRAVAKFGEMSFSVYLLHFLVITVFLARNRWIEPTGNPVWDAFLTTVLGVLPVSLAIAVVTFHGIERPFLRWRRAYLGTDDRPRIAAQPDGGRPVPDAAPPEQPEPALRSRRAAGAVETADR
ncbi:acyltransferase family protein [Streptomyces cavernicola]|uniref:Acyltransferase n=1 Tax=Streptomyces cavernicola TaxID=3043613 RepID=A0ABT6S9Z6_9ACTN|nr:acyltransferase [Streptomyces sp. B-S-A6]MDI3405003.1 acyltransferase [Streptomyces sp. B-S-A6]